MGRGRYFLERLADEADLTAEPLPGQPIVEQIVVKVKYGYVCVCGCGLELMRMTKEQLVIRGRIDGVTLQRRG